jgi:hypothetical protein
VLDSPAAATLVLSRSEVEAALGLSKPPDGGAQFELAEPGSGTDVPFAEMIAADAAGGREFEIGEPAPEPPEPMAEETSAPEPPFEIAREADPLPPEVPPATLEPPQLDDAETTGEIPREEVERVLGAAPDEPAPVAPVAPEEAPAPPASASADEAGEPDGELGDGPIADLDRAITRFNQLHRVMYRAIRSEVGAGAANFIHACRVGLSTGHGTLFEGSRLLPDGTWDPEGLRRAFRERCVNEPWSDLESLLEREIEMLRPQIDDARAQALREQLSELRRTP